MWQDHPAWENIHEELAKVVLPTGQMSVSLALSSQATSDGLFRQRHLKGHEELVANNPGAQTNWPASVVLLNLRPALSTL